MNYSIVDKQNATHYVWGNACDSWVLADTQGLSVKQESIPPGSREKQHLHNHSQQFFFIIDGEATFYLDDKKERLTAQTGILVPATTRHYIANESDAALNFLVISQPAINGDRLEIAQ